MAKILHRVANRAAAHKFQAKAIKEGTAGATCTETADEVIVWDSQPDPAEVDAAIGREPEPTRPAAKQALRSTRRPGGR